MLQQWGLAIKCVQAAKELTGEEIFAYVKERLEGLAKVKRISNSLMSEEAMKVHAVGSPNPMHVEVVAPTPPQGNSPRGITPPMSPGGSSWGKGKGGGNGKSRAPSADKGRGRSNTPYGKGAQRSSTPHSTGGGKGWGRPLRDPNMCYACNRMGKNPHHDFTQCEHWKRTRKAGSPGVEAPRGPSGTGGRGPQGQSSK